MRYFDLHVHPSLKGALSVDPQSYNAWNTFKLYREFFGVLKKFRQIIDSQANLTQLEKKDVLCVAAIIGLETAFAANFAIQKILASRIVSPLSRKLLIQVAREQKTYFETFRKDLGVLLDSRKIKEFALIKNVSEIVPGKVNVVLSVEGAHSFQDVTDSSTDADKARSIKTNFQNFKNNAQFRLHHLTLTHLTRQAPCVHCFGVKIKMLGVNLTPDIRFQPDPQKIGISPLGEDVISIAYDNTSSKRVLIDIKHMSYVSRKQFYKMRNDKGWNTIPLIMSHGGVTGTSFSAAKILKIKRANSPSECDEVFWYQAEGINNTFFNPWTINLYDEDIIEIIRSKGLIGLSLDERILGYGDIFGEFMSPPEVAELQLQGRASLTVPIGFKALSDDRTDKVFQGFLEDPEVQEVLRYEDAEEDSELRLERWEETNFGGEMLFDLDEPEAELAQSASHVDYLANNIAHIIKVGLQEGFDGAGGRPDVLQCICLGSDLDGIVDAMNFPFRKGERSINKNNWITVDEYDNLESELEISLGRAFTSDPYLSGKNLNASSIVSGVMTSNGQNFLRRNFI